MTSSPATAQALWSTKARQGHGLHRVCAFQGSFPPQLPAYFLDRYPGAEVVLDPFCGRGTVLLEAVARGRRVIGNDLLSVARALSRVKIRCAPRTTVLAEIAELDLTRRAPECPPEMRPFYHPETWGQLYSLRESRRSDELTALALGRMHGHSSGFFSGFTFNVISLRPDRARAMQAKHGTSAPPRDVRTILARAASRFIPEGGLQGDGHVLESDARRLGIPDETVGLVITSPPFFDVINYEDVNWLRRWFLHDESETHGILDNAIKEAGQYVQFLADVLTEMARVVIPGGRVVFEVGPVKGTQRMSDLVLRAVERVDRLHHAETLVNDFANAAVPKISRAMRTSKKTGEQTTTTQNQCVVLERR